ncbi:ATP-binding protein [Magnetospirillum sp. 64-120]|uniref:ATP-binding protein n=1 Tax=Magnetospirillum sp. 64-120 TaxID=1895778 RepID=UPI000928C883|nr:ATP-binding protein [Magnetospirillum sp. 64-120]OJX76794.1 MAG: hybrid sensor histidine kinase/response regulator [Magnetospirillum sp. 64-120]
MIAHSVADQLRQIDRAVTTLTRSTEALLRAPDEMALLEHICRIAVEVAGFKMSWVGYAQDDDSRSIRSMAIAGWGVKFLEDLQMSWGDCKLGAGPVGTAIRTGITQVTIDTETDSRFSPWRSAARLHGFRSCIALPLTLGHERIGALSIFAAEPDAFDADVVRLLEDLARNLSYGIGAQRMRVQHDRTLKQLAESEERYRSLIELTPDAILVHAMGEILFANPTALQIFNTDLDSLVGRSVLTLIPESEHANVRERFARQAPGKARAEHKMYRLDGTEFDAEVVGTTITFHDRSCRLLVIRDVSDRREVQEQLVQTAKLATLGEMAAGLVHELSQPLNIIRLTAEGALLFLERGKATPEWQAQQLQLIADQSQRTAEIIDDIRIFSRRDNSPVQIFDAMGAVRSALTVIEGQLRPDGIELVTDLPYIPLPVRGRRVQLEQVIMNLLSNAQHALKEKRESSGGTSVARITVSARQDGDRLLIRVADNGPGIPAAVRERIFEPFFTTKEAGRGTGLGLSVSFGIINAMSGRLELENTKQGACFVVTLPIDTEEPETAEAPIPQVCPIDAHIMVVDDEKTAVETLGRYLTEMGYRVTLCGSGSDALAKFRDDPADVVITDLRMPSGDGEQLVEQLREFDPLQPIVIVTGHLGATERLAENLQDDRCAVLKKPVALGKLGEIIATFLLPPGDEEFPQN